MDIFVIAEIGINHNGDLGIAKDLIDVAKLAGANSVKFQKRNINLVYSKEELDTPRESPWGTTQRQQKEGLEFDFTQYQEIDCYCKTKGIDWIELSPKKCQGAGLSVLLQTMCADCLKEGVLELQRQNCQVSALIFDGCLVEKANIVPAAIESVNQKLQTTPEFKYVKFAVKPFNDIVDTSIELPVTFIRKNFNNNTNYCFYYYIAFSSI